MVLASYSRSISLSLCLSLASPSSFPFVSVVTALWQEKTHVTVLSRFFVAYLWLDPDNLELIRSSVPRLCLCYCTLHQTTEQDTVGS